MIDPKYAANCLKRGFQRYIRYSKINASIDSEPYRVSFYVKDYDKAGKQYLARSSDHHLKMQRMADKDEPWKGDNVSIDFIVPDSEQDKKKLRARVEQNASGTIQPFDVTTYQYDSTLIDPTDITTIFKAIIVFLNGGGYTDPFIGTPKQAKTLPRHSNIKPHRGSTSSTPLTCSRNISIDDNYLNEMTIYCLGDIIPLNENKQYNKKRNMNKKLIKLTETDLHRIVKESVKKVLKESNITPNLEQDMERYRDNPKRFMYTLNAFGMRYESILKDAEKKGLDDIAEVAKQRLYQIADEMEKAREQWNLHA
jgi:hypothetical protein